MKICNYCSFRIPEEEYKLFGECGQCGKNDYREYGDELQELIKEKVGEEKK